MNTLTAHLNDVITRLQRADSMLLECAILDRARGGIECSAPGVLQNHVKEPRLNA